MFPKRRRRSPGSCQRTVDARVIRPVLGLERTGEGRSGRMYLSHGATAGHRFASELHVRGEGAPGRRTPGRAHEGRSLAPPIGATYFLVASVLKRGLSFERVCPHTADAFHDAARIRRRMNGARRRLERGSFRAGNAMSIVAAQCLRRRARVVWLQRRSVPPPPRGPRAPLACRRAAGGRAPV